MTLDLSISVVQATGLVMQEALMQRPSDRDYLQSGQQVSRGYRRTWSAIISHLQTAAILNLTSWKVSSCCADQCEVTTGTGPAVGEVDLSLTEI